jgi:hypothetical protein
MEEDVDKNRVRLEMCTLVEPAMREASILGLCSLTGGSLTLLGVVNLWRKRHIRCWFSGLLSSVSLSGAQERGAVCPRGPSRVDTLSRARTSTFAGRRWMETVL